VGIAETERLRLREFAEGDAAFVVALVNDPAWLRFIGDRNVHTPDEARTYLDNGPVRSYAKHGFGLYAVTLRSDDAPVGMCGLIKRDELDDVDLGFAFLPGARGRGYAREAAGAVLELARTKHGLARLVAIVAPDNGPSIRLLGDLGFTFEREHVRDGKDPTDLYARNL
jgi:ribosomal-protein-alanine N-acetyltransferase